MEITKMLDNNTISNNKKKPIKKQIKIILLFRKNIVLLQKKNCNL